MTAAPYSSSSPPPGGLSPSPTRTVVSFLLFVHLFALAAALVYTPGVSSDLAQRVANIPVLEQYRQALDMNLPYTYHLTFGGEELDFDYQVEVDLELANGERRLVTLPPQDVWPGVRKRRYQMLAFNTALGVGQDSVESILPRGITAGLLDQTGATRANFRCRVHLGLGRDRVLAAADPFAADTWRTVYEATIWRAADGEIRLLKQESASDSAPSAAPAGNPAEWSPPPLDGQPARPAGDLPANPAPPGPTSAPPANPSSGRSGMNRTPLTFPPSR